MSTIRAILPTTQLDDAAAPRARTVLVALVLRLEGMLERRHSRRALYLLTDDQLKDIGLSRADAYRESVKPFWD